MALDGRVKGEDTDLASSTLLADENSRDIFGMVISYTVKVSIVKVFERRSSWIYGWLVGFKCCSMLFSRKEIIYTDVFHFSCVWLESSHKL